MTEELERFARLGRKALDRRNEVGMPQDVLNVSITANRLSKAVPVPVVNIAKGCPAALKFVHEAAPMTLEPSPKSTLHTLGVFANFLFY